ncbi:MAG: MerR family transcriptional regulator [Myxococcales bacterium]|nr:MerR family transcriptional regulator [Myxococcales bacterium]
MTRARELPDQLFFKIGEVAEIVGVRPHVLRYWESEFRQLRPMKTRGSHRVYKRRDVEVAMLIRQLLHDEGYTIPGAKKRLREVARQEAPVETAVQKPMPVIADAPVAPAAKSETASGGLKAAPRPLEPRAAAIHVAAKPPVERASARREANLRAELLALRHTLQAFLDDLDRRASTAVAAPKSATVEQVVLAPATLPR